MGCLKLAHRTENEPTLRCVWKSREHSKKGVNWYDYGTRFYDPSLVRFISIDSLASEFPYWGPYNYASDNPAKFIDLDGLEPATYVSANLKGSPSKSAGYIKAKQMMGEKPNPNRKNLIRRIVPG